MKTNERSDAAFESILRLAFKENFAQEMAELPTDEELAEMYTPSERHEKRMKALFRSARIKDMFGKSLRIAKRVAVIIFVLATMMFGVLLVNPEVRATVRNAIINRYMQFTRFQFESTSDVFVPLEWHLTYVPEGFDIYYSFDGGNLVHVTFVNQAGEFLIIEYAEALGASFGISSTNTRHEEIDYMGITFHILYALSNDRESSIVWYNQGYSFAISSILPISTMIQIATAMEATPIEQP